jgi:hypothetical protein
MALPDNISTPEETLNEAPGGQTGSHAPAQGLPFFVAPATGQGKNTLRLELIPVACWKLNDVRFAFGSSFVLPATKSEFIELANLRKQHPGAPMSVFGHADPVGDDDFNKELSGHRAKSIYAVLVRDAAHWESLYQSGRNEGWGIESVQRMLTAIGHPAGPPTGSMNPTTKTAVEQFQDKTGLAVDGSPGPKTREKLFLAYMDFLSPEKVQKTDFLSKGVDVKGKGDFQGCSEFNPVMVFSKSQAAAFAAASDKTERTAQNAVNRRVMVLLFRPGTVVLPDRWPCPRASEGTAGCKRRFWSDGESRRSPQPAQREFKDTKDTFGCRFYHRLVVSSPCEGIKPEPPVILEVNPIVTFGVHVPDPAVVEAKAASAPTARAGAPAKAADAAAPAAGAAAPAPVNVAAPAPSVLPGQRVVVVKKPDTNPQFASVILQTDTDFDGRGTFTRSSNRIRFFSDVFPHAEILFNGRDNVFPGAALRAGVTVLAQGARRSDAMEDVTLTLTLTEGTKRIGPPATAKMTAIEVTLDICRRRTAAATDPVALSAAQKVTPGRTVHIQSAPVKQRARAMLIVRRVLPRAFTGSLTLAVGPGVTLFDNEAPTGGELAQTGTITIVHDGAFPSEGRRFFVEGTVVSTAARDVQITLGVLGGEPDADHVRLTVVRATLDIAQARDTFNVDPSALSDSDKLNIGRFIHVQDASNHHGRAMMFLKVEPLDWDGQFTLAPIESRRPRVQVFLNETGGAALANPLNIPHTAASPADGIKRFAQGARVSGALRDSGFKLGIRDVEEEVDRVAITVVRLRSLSADVPSTPAKTNRLGNSPVNRHTFAKGAGALAAADYSENFDTNPPLVLVKDSIGALDPINLSVVIQPAGIPTLWEVTRDTRPAPNGDNAEIIALSVNARPTLTQDPGDPLKATLLADAGGSFYIRAYVDTNGTRTFNGTDAANNRVDREPYIVMPLVLVQVIGFTNASVTRPANARLIPAAPTANTGVQVTTGLFTNPARAGCHNDAIVEVIGGAADGLRGLNKVFAGWVNNELASPGSPTVPPTEDNVANYRDPNPPNTIHPRFTVWVRPPNHTPFQTFRPPPPVAGFTVQGGPVLDTTNFGQEGTGGNRCVGTEGAPGPPLAIRKTARPNGTGAAGNVGQRWRVQMWDSPGDNCPRRHEGFPAARLIDYRFNIDFLSALVFWTNVSGVQRPTVHAACRLYSLVLINTWTIRVAMTFNAAGVSVITTPLAIVMVQDPTPVKAAVPVDGTDIEVRGPVSLNLLIVDATT